VVIATARIKIMLGDTAVAVYPKDHRSAAHWSRQLVIWVQLDWKRV
jgi:valyl-tRNA synthetase